MDNVVYASDQAELCRDIKKEGPGFGDRMDDCLMKDDGSLLPVCFQSSSVLRYPLRRSTRSWAR